MYNQLSNKQLGNNNWPFIKPKVAFAIVNGKKDFKRDLMIGLVTECCHKSCTGTEMSNYCGRNGLLEPDE